MKYFIEDTTLKALGDAIRDKTGGTDPMSPDEMIDAISTISTDTGPTIDIPTPAISVSNTGRITAYVTVATPGYIEDADTVSVYKQLDTHGGKTITPKKDTQTTTDLKGKFMTGEITVAGDIGLVSANIRKGVTLFAGTDGEIVGTYESTSVNMQSSKEATSNNITIEPDPGYDGLSQVIVKIPEYDGSCVKYQV